MELHVIIGRLDYDVRAGKTQNNKDFTAFTLVVEKDFRGQKFTSYPSFTAWGETSKVAAQLGKGDIVQVFSQEAKASTYESKKDGGKIKAKLEYTVRDLQVISRGSGVTQQSPAKESRPTPPPAPKRQDNDSGEEPF